MYSISGFISFGVTNIGGVESTFLLRKRCVCYRGFVNKSAIGVDVWRFVEGGEHGGAI
jgi:hypothetical protein